MPKLQRDLRHWSRSLAQMAPDGEQPASAVTLPIIPKANPKLPRFPDLLR